MLLYSPKLDALNKALDGDKNAYESLRGDNSAQREDGNEAANKKHRSSEKTRSSGKTSLIGRIRNVVPRIKPR